MALEAVVMVKVAVAVVPEVATVLAVASVAVGCACAAARHHVAQSGQAIDVWLMSLDEARMGRIWHLTPCR